MTEPGIPGWLGIVRGVRSVNGGPPTPDCLDDDSLSRFVDGTTPVESRVLVLTHLATCARCRATVAATSRALHDPAMQPEIAPLAFRRRFAPLAAAAAIAAAVLLFAWPSGSDNALTPTHRASPIAAAPAPQGLSPSGTVQSAATLHWSSVTGASRYRVTLFDSAGVARYEAVLTDTVLALPDSAIPVPGRRYWWSVNAALGIDRWVASALIEFRVQPEPR